MIARVLVLSSAAFAAALFSGAGCAPATSSLGSTPVSLQGRDARGAPQFHGWLQPDYQKTGPLLYYSDDLLGSVFVYNIASAPKLVGEIDVFSFPQAIWVDQQGQLFVQNAGWYDVYGFRPGQVNPFRTLVDLNGLPSSVCGDSHGTIYLPHGTTNAVSVFKGDVVWPTATLTDTNARDVTGCAVDGASDIFLTVSRTNDHIGVDEFVAGSQQPTAIAKQIATGQLTGIALDQSANLYLNVVSHGSTVYTFAPPYATAQSSFKFSYQYGISQIGVDAQAAHLWAAANSEVVQFDLPGGSVNGSIVTTGSRGIALYSAGAH